MEKEKYQRAAEIMRELDKIEYDYDGFSTLPVKVYGIKNAAMQIVNALWPYYEDEITEFVEKIASDCLRRREERKLELEKEFDEL